MTDQALDGAALPRNDGLADRAYAVLRDAILSHALPPGTRLSVPDIARRLDISRSPAREAIARIEYEGLAHSTPHKGAMVAAIDFAALVEIYEIRAVLEGLAARLACQRADDSWLAELGRLCDRHELAVTAGDLASHIELDGEFHHQIREAAGNARLADSLDRLQSQIRLAMATTSQRGGGMKVAFGEHRTLLDALVARDADRAESVARAHIERLRDSLHAASDEGAVDGSSHDSHPFDLDEEK